MTRKQLLHQAEQCVCHDRENQYGSPEDNFSSIAELWSWWLDKTVTAHDVAIMMAMLKIGRIKSGQAKADNYVDLIGYAACAGELAFKEEK